MSVKVTVLDQRRQLVDMLRARPARDDGTRLPDVLADLRFEAMAAAGYWNLAHPDARITPEDAVLPTLFEASDA
jgi:hypothetical protein